jgi:hypothetical protein
MVRFSTRFTSFELPQQGALVDVVDERPLAVDLEDRQPLPVARLEGLVARDVHRVVFEAKTIELRTCTLAEAAPLPMEEANPRDRARA